MSKAKEFLNPSHLQNQCTEEELIEALKKVKADNDRIRRSFRYDAISMSKQVTI